MSDVARACGVSQATVSLVLGRAPGTRVSGATRDAVEAMALEMGYRRPRPAPDRRPLVAMLIDEATSSPHVGALIDGAAEAAVEMGLMVMALPTAGDAAAEAAALDLMAALPVAGVLYARLITQAVKPPPGLAAWPTVLLNCHAIGDPYPSVVPGDFAAGLTATLALIDAGHRRVAFIGGDPIIEAARERLRGYRHALATREVAADPALVIKVGWTVSGGYAAFRRMLTLPDPPTAVFCFCDRTALGVYDAAAQAGLSIPGDLSVVGFDDEDFCVDLRPPMTTMELPHAEMARHAVEELARMIAGDGPRARPARLRFDCPLIARGSVAAPRTPNAAAARMRA